MEKRKTVFYMVSRILLSALILPMIFVTLSDVVVFGGVSPTSDKKAVRVGYYLRDGYQEIDENGAYSGYGYDYLKELSQYSDWEYEFVIEDFQACIKMLEKGELDIVGGIDKAALKSNSIMYSNTSNCKSEIYLYTKYNSHIAYDDFKNFNGMRVAVLEGDYQEVYLDEYCESNDLAVIKKHYVSIEEMEQALKNNSVDAIYANVEANGKYDKIIANMEEQPLYYGVNKENKALLEDLDAALQNIKDSTPFYDMQIQNKYFIKGNTKIPSFTREELEYIKEKGTVKVSYDKGWQPIEYYDEKTGDIKGITKDVFELLSKYTGLKFEFVKAEDLSSALQDVKTGRSDMISFVSHDYSISDARGIYTSSICINASLVGVVSKERTFDTISQLAMPKGYFLDILKHYEVTEYNTVEECFEAVNNGTAGATIANAYVANYYLANPKFTNLIRQDLIGYSEDLALGVSQKEDIALLNILNKGLQCISDMELSNIVLSNYVTYEQPKLIKFYYSDPVFFLSMVALSCIVVVGILVYIIMLKNKVNCTNLQMIELLDIEKQRVERSLREEAEKDLLTGLFNRRRIESETREFLFRLHLGDTENDQVCEDALHTFMILDLDGFKSVNDKYGHPEGDGLLKRIAEELLLISGNENLVGRLGGDEFVFLFKNITGANEAVRLSKKIHRAIGEIAGEKQEWQGVSVSIGVTFFENEVYSFKELYEKADEALYKAKKQGKNRVVFYEDMQ